MKGLQNISEASQLYCIDAIRMHFEICDEQWKNINKLRLRLEKQILDKKSKQKLKRSDVLKIISSSWLFIDSAYRVAKLANNIKGLSHKESRYKTFEIESRKAKDFREIYQHLDKELKSKQEGNNPVMGLFSWVCQNQTMSITLSLGMLAAGSTVHTMVVDRFDRCFVHDMQFSANHQDIFFSKLKTSLDEFMDYFQEWLKKNKLLSNKVIEPSVFTFDISGLKNA